MKHSLLLMVIFAFSGSLANAQSAVPTIDPAPSDTDSFIAAKTPTSLKGYSVRFFTAAGSGSCSSTAEPIALAADTSDEFTGGAQTRFAIESDQLRSGNYICGQATKEGSSEIPLLAVKITAGTGALKPTPSIDPAPSSTDTFVTIKTPTALTGSIVTLRTAETADACSSSKGEVPLEPDTSTVFGKGAQTKFAVEIGQLKSGSYLCGEVTKADGTKIELAAVKIAVGSADETISIASQPAISDSFVTVTTGAGLTDGMITLKTASTKDACSASQTTITPIPNTSAKALSSGKTSIAVSADSLKDDTYICASVQDKQGQTKTSEAMPVQPGCSDRGEYSDCTYEFTLVGGIEQSDLSAQSSQTNGFYDLFIRRPVDSSLGIWFRSRYLGSPSSSSTLNVIGAANDPSGTLTAKTLPQTVTAVDYVVGLQGKNLSWGFPTKRFTYAPVAGFGATTPLSATTVVNGFQVPAFGTAECDQLGVRFTAKNGYNPTLPGSGYYSSTSQGCVVQPPPGETATQTTPGTQITTVAFSNEDRSSFLLKWGAGLRLIDRYSPDCLSQAGCPRMRADFTIGQDQAITAGYLRHLVVKADAIIPIFNSGIYFFAASANRIEHNTNYSPLILTPVTITSATASSGCPSGSVCVPSANVFVLPYKQADRDFYRIGLAIDATKIFKSFKSQ